MMGHDQLSVALRNVAAATVLAGLLTVFCLVPGVSPSGSVLAAIAETSDSVTPSSTVDTSTPATSTPATAAPKPKPKPKPKKVDKRPKAPKFVPHKGKAIYIDRKHQRVYLYFNGRQIDKFKCSTSRTLPRRGTYHMKKRRRQSWSFSGSVTFYWQTIFTKGPHGHNIAFHSVPVDRRGHKIAPLGKPVSHGCVRVPYKKAKFIYHWIKKKTPIVVRP
jgi:lipoprotein-anchoring transpeptidase ErfK/SrfK